MASISLVQQPVNTRTFTFDPHKRPQITASWTKYSTLVEIVSLSSSPNQLRDAASDLKRLLDPTSHVPASWLVVLVSLGFQSGSGGVCRSFWEILLGLEEKQLVRLFGGPEGRRLLQETILPYSATASAFTVRQSTPERCEHGEQVSRWLGGVLAALETDSRRFLARAVLEWIDARMDNLFAPARAYILKGVLDGVRHYVAFDDITDVRMLVKIAKVSRL
jgi:tRNA guanosine-2'-O-methyltransferase